jgi:hypothetical protein
MTDRCIRSSMSPTFQSACVRNGKEITTCTQGSTGRLSKNPNSQEPSLMRFRNRGTSRAKHPSGYSHFLSKRSKVRIHEEYGKNILGSPFFLDTMCNIRRLAQVGGNSYITLPYLPGRGGDCAFLPICFCSLMEPMSIFQNRFVFREGGLSFIRNPSAVILELFIS